MRRLKTGNSVCSALQGELQGPHQLYAPKEEVADGTWAPLR